MNNQNLPQTPKTFLRTITIIHLALLVGQVIFSVLVFTITKSTFIDLTNTKDPFLFVAPILAVACFIASNFMYKLRLSEAINKPTLKGKLMGYQAALIIRCALLEGPSLFGIVTYMVTRNFLFLLISGLIILYFITIRPTKDKIANDLNLDYEDKMQFDSEDVLV
ncbi:hypothetical protein SAMN05216490_3982 [Mucilaginibacter mallensis]|uniref:Uncharacterized protein n=1 Tax=Mucilaginibacter mallensis TaxID=652787 RepID=A0A1H2B904_MUCMA|nr:hypothetical protein [Mucilaginibacter mallensis]SDT54711.1 hypothetical protein SAMN05216490_3982 [Mucilaginibacter mallensis]